MARLHFHYKLAVTVVAVVLLGSLLFFGHSKAPEDSGAVTPPAGEVSIAGQIVCLPHKNTDGPQTLECAFGLKDDEGRYFGLRDTDPMFKNISGVPMNVRVTVNGTFEPRSDSTYQSIGVIAVREVVQ